MGVMTESAILNQARKAQSETNARLDALVVAQWETNRLLATLVQMLSARQTH
jgi:hypothetical protein